MYRFLKKFLQNFPQFVVIHTVKGYSRVTEAEIDVLLEFSCFLYEPTNAGDLISRSSTFSKLSLYIWNFHLFKNFLQFFVIHTNGFNVVNETEVDVFLELSCYFYDLADVGNLISCSSAFSKTSLNI